MNTILHSSNDKPREISVQFKGDFGGDYMLVVILGMKMT